MGTETGLPLAPPGSAAPSAGVSRAYAYAGLALLGLASLALGSAPHAVFPHWRLESIPLHSVVEMFGAMMALLTGVQLYLRTMPLRMPVNVPILAAAFVAMGLLDAFHAAVDPGAGFVWLRSAASVAGGALFVLAIVVGNRPAGAADRWLPPAAALVSLALAAGIVIWRPSLPAMIEDGGFTGLATALNAAAGALFLLAAAWFVRAFHRRPDGESYVFAVLGLLFGLAGLLFPWSLLWDDAWWYWHAERVAGYAALLTLQLRRELAAQRELNRAAEVLRQIPDLRAASQYARSLLETSLDPLVTINPEGKITDVNEAAIKVTGVPRAQLVGTDFADYFTEPDRARAGYRQVFAAGFVTDYPLTVRHRDGTLTDVLYNASVYKDAAGNVLGVFAAARNVTALKQASQYARSLIETSLDPLVTISPEGKVTDVNRATEQATGLPREKLIGSDFADYFTEPDNAQKGYQQVLREGAVRDYPLTLRHVSGPAMDVLYNASVYRDVHGNVLGVFAAARDVTERKRAEDALRRSETALKEAQRVAGVGSWELEADTGAVTWSEEIHRIFGHDPSLPAPGLEEQRRLMTPESFAALDAAIANTRQTGQPYALDLEVIRPDGTRRWIAARGEAVHGVRGEVVRLRGTVLDITERKQAEDEVRRLNIELEQRVQQRTAELAAANTDLQRSTAFLANLLEAIPAPVFYKDRQGVYLGGNGAFFKYLGKPRESVVGKDVYGISPKHLADLYKKADDELLASGGAQVYESRVRYADGTEHDVIFHKATFPAPDGSAGGLIGTIVDISERKQHEQERERLLAELGQRAGALEAANHELEAFAYSVSHDLRAPLRAVDGFARMVVEDYSARLDDEGRRKLGVIGDSARQMGRLIDDLLAFSRMARREMAFAAIDMTAQARDVADELRQLETGRVIELSIAPLPAAHGDPAMLRQVWANLLSNAVKFTRPRAPARIEVGARTDGGENIYIIKDNGVGFDMQYVGKLFGVFQRLHGPRSSRARAWGWRSRSASSTATAGASGPRAR